MALIKVENLTKTFQRQKRQQGLWGAVQGLFSREYEFKTAVDNISFEVERGEVVGYIGPNGAGKSTTIKMLIGILVPTSGHVEVRGLVPYKNRIENAKRMGVVFGQRTQLWWDIPVSESLNLMRYMFKIPDQQYHANLELFSEILDLKEFIHVPVRQLSLGQRMRADICAALLHNPDILYLDEPTIGLDVVAKENIRRFIREINQERNTTVILTTHDMSDIEKLCSRVMVIDRGHIIYDGGLQQLKELYGTEETLTVETEDDIPDFSSLYTLGIQEVSQEANKVSVRYDRKKINSTSIIQWIMERCKVKDFVVRETEIDEVIRKMYLGQPYLSDARKQAISS
jgi:ABC-2 type transport system ATP-binding protein